MWFAFLFASLSALSVVRGHGGIYNYTIGGVDYIGQVTSLFTSLF